MKYLVTMTTMTPLHIGTGTELLNEYDLKICRGKTHRLNIDAILDYALTGDMEQIDQHLLNTPPAQLVKPEELIAHPEFSTYVLDGTPQPKSQGAGRVREQIKDVYGRLYLPGSSIKGALRTAIARGIGSRMTRPLRINDQRDSRGRTRPKAADDWLEADIFRPGKDHATHDLLRALQVADSQPVDDSPLLINVRVVKGDRQESPIDVEAVPAGVTFETTIHLDEYLCKIAATELGWDEDRVRWLHRLPVACRNVAGRRFVRERQYFAQAGLPGLAQVYAAWLKELETLKGSNRFFLQVGWGGGWENKTMGETLLARDKVAFAQLRETFGLGRPPRGGKSWHPQPEDTFPASRRLVVRPDGQPVCPLGWLQAEVKPCTQRR